MDDSGDKVSCVLCQRSEETEVTGALSTKDGVAAHQNCLLFSSGLFCRNSPQYDDLFGFSVADVLNEVKRGSKLMCNKCKLKGATAGCEVKRCKKSYHYPCAVQERAEIIEDVDKGSFGLYCFNHNSQTREINGSINGHPSSSTKSGSSRDHSAAGPSKEVCSLACKKTDGNNGLESVSNNIMSCYKHAPTSRKRSSSSDSSAARQPTVYSSDSNSSGSARRSSAKGHCRDKQEGTPSKRKTWNLVMSDESSNSGMNEPDSEMAIFAPLETDIEESANSVSQPQAIRKDTESPTCSPSGNQLEDESRNGNKDGDETILESVSGHISSCLQMDAESESLLTVSRPLPVPMAPASTQTAPTLYPSVFLCKMKQEEELPQRKDEGLISENGPVNSPEQHDAGPSVPQQSSAEPPPSSYHSKPHSPPPSAGSAISPVLPETICISSPSSPESNIDSISFWKSCNAAECTQAIFNAFINEMNDISSRIQSDKASQEDCDRALKVMTASGKLAELVAKQQEELQKKQMELQKAAAAMKEIVSTLSR